MKQLGIAAFLILISSTVSAQGFDVSAVGGGSGQTPIASGVTVFVDFKTENGGFMEVMAQSEQGWFMIGKGFKKNRASCDLYASAGYLEDSPWVGPYVSCAYKVTNSQSNNMTVSVMTWPYFFVREPESWREDSTNNEESALIGYYSSASVSFGNLNFSLGHMNFLNDPNNWLPGVGYGHKVGKFMVNGSVTRDSNANSLMYFIGATWYPKD